MLAPPVEQTQKAPAVSSTKRRATDSRARIPPPATLLQRSIGNRAVVSLRSQSPGQVQRKLAIGSVHDPLEHEADHVAERVMGMTDASVTLAADTATLRRKCSCAGKDSASQGTCAACKEEDEHLRRKATSGARHDSPVPAAVHETLATAGQPLDARTRGFFESRFGLDFAAVRVHDDSLADASARSVNALAYTVGEHVVFRQGAFSPATTDGRRLLAHELTHTVQQNTTRRTAPAPSRVTLPDDPSESEAEHAAMEVMQTPERGGVKSDRAQNLTHTVRQGTAPAQVSRKSQDSPSYVQSVRRSVDAIIEALSGVTFAWNSDAILKLFQSQDAPYLRAVLKELKTRGPEHEMTGDEMIRWFFSKLTAEDRRTLRQLLIKQRVLDELGPMLVEELVDMLGAWLDASAGIMGILEQFAGADLDDLLRKLEVATAKDEGAMVDYLFDRIDRVSAQKLREYLIERGGPRSTKYAIYSIASKIHALLAGFLGRVSHSESTMVVENFWSVPAELRVAVQYRLDELTRASMGKPAEDVLMLQLDPSDYEKLRELEGVRLRVFSRKVTARDEIYSAIKWADMVAAWIVCGAVGVITGALAAVWDLVKGLWDLGKGVWHILWAAAYIQSGGAVGSENYLAVKDFCIGMAKTLANPRAAFDQMWNEVKEEFNTIEGPLADCRRAEFVVRKVVGLVVNIALIFVAGYGLVKAGVSAVLEFAELAQKVGVVEAIVQTAGRAGRAILKFVPAKAGELGKFASSLLKPGRLLLKVRGQLQGILLAVEDEGLWGYMRGRTGGLIDKERTLWRNNRDRWRKLGLERQERQAALREKVGAINEGLQKNQVPEDPDQVAGDFDKEANKLGDEVDDLEREVKGDPEKEKEKGALLALPKDYLEWEEQLSDDTQKALKANSELRRTYAEMDPEVRRTLTFCESPCIPTDPLPSPADIKGIKDLLKKLKLPEEHFGLREYFYDARKRGELSEAIAELEDLKSLEGLQKKLEEFIVEKGKRTYNVKASLDSDDRWIASYNNGPKVREYEIGSYSELKARGTNGFFEAHHGVQGQWARERIPFDLYDHNEAKTINLRNRRTGSPHQRVTARQNDPTRRAGRATRTYVEEQELMVADMEKADVPLDVIEAFVDETDQYFGRLYKELVTRRVSPADLKKIFGAWKPK